MVDVDIGDLGLESQCLDALQIGVGLYITACLKHLDQSRWMVTEADLAMSEYGLHITEAQTEDLLQVCKVSDSVVGLSLLAQSRSL